LYNVEGDIAINNAKVFMTELAKYGPIVYAGVKSNSNNNNLENMSMFINNEIQVRVMSNKPQPMSLQLFNEQGKLVRHKQVDGDAGWNLIELDNIQQLSAGAYFLRLKSDGAITTRKLIKQ